MTSLRDLNLKSVKRTDPSATRLLCTASHTVLYIFKDSKWERAEVEGTLHLYKRTGPGEYAFVILNRLHANNYLQSFAEISTFQVEDGLLMYGTQGGPVFGLWVYAEEEREQLAGQFEKIVNNVLEDGQEEDSMVAIVLPSRSSINSSPAPSHASSNVGQGILSMLNRAARKQSQSQQPHYPPGVPQPSQPNALLQQLFSAASAPRPLPTVNESTPPGPDPAAQILRMARFMSVKYPQLSQDQFKNLAVDLLFNDEIFWTDLYAVYTQYQSHQ